MQENGGGDDVRICVRQLVCMCMYVCVHEKTCTYAACRKEVINVRLFFRDSVEAGSWVGRIVELALVSAARDASRVLVITEEEACFNHRDVLRPALCCWRC